MVEYDNMLVMGQGGYNIYNVKEVKNMDEVIYQVPEPVSTWVGEDKKLIKLGKKSSAPVIVVPLVVFEFDAGKVTFCRRAMKKMGFWIYFDFIFTTSIIPINSPHPTLYGFPMAHYDQVKEKIVLSKGSSLDSIVRDGEMGDALLKFSVAGRYKPKDIRAMRSLIEQSVAKWEGMPPQDMIFYA
jgi:hypothetical protein